MPDFAVRSALPEIMDDLDCSGEVVHQTLRELEFINAWLGGNAVTLGALKQLLEKTDASRTLTIADLGCGSGEMLRLINTWAVRNQRRVKLIGIDANPHIIAYAKTNLQDLPGVELLALDIFSEEFRKRSFDVITGTLFYHHFNAVQLKKFFSQLREQVSIGMVINDIHRHPLAYYSIKILTQLFSKSAMVKYDAPLSVLRAFSREELGDIVAGASWKKFSLDWKWAFRWQLIATP